MKKFLVIMVLFVFQMVSAVGCDSGTPEQQRSRKAFVEQINALHAGDLIVSNSRDGFNRVQIIKRINCGQIWFDGALEDESIAYIARDTVRIVLLDDTDWAETLKTYYRNYREKYEVPQPNPGF